ncbi:MAG: orc1/cdc6 family replication initiation protein [Candidatus Methanomethylophilaceae archaeon]|nr:orc1/cdc6 family replication initiation protein [Candidatus Methanomethylophilaceae archaeon]
MTEEQESIFIQYVQKRKQLIKNKKVLQTTYIPEQLPHRKEQIDRIVSIISIALSGEKPSNIIVYGKTGTGKTAVLNYIGKELRKADPVTEKCYFLYVNCEVVDTAYGILYNIASQFIKDISKKIPFTGWSFEKLYEELYMEIENLNRVFVIVLDEVDHMITKKGDAILYYLAKINEHLSKSKVSLIGISNNMKFLELLEPKARSRLGGESMIFPPYSRDQLEDILEERAAEVFDEGVLEDTVIPVCAAMAAKNEGDARMAIDLLRTAADIAERNGDNVITEAHVKSAKNSMDMNVVEEAIKTLTVQSKCVLLSIVKNTESNNRTMITGDVYIVYKDIVDILGISPLTQRRITDLISELDMMGLINASIRSFGRAGRTKEITLEIPKDIVNRFKDDPLFDPIKNYKVSTQTKLM